MTNIIHLKNITPTQRDKLARENEARLNNLTPEEQFERQANQNMIRTLESIGYFDSSNNDFGGY